jgi:hypothetical protein
MFILCTVDYITRFGFTLDLPADGSATIMNMVMLLTRMTCSFLGVFCGTIAILMPKYVSCITIFGYIGLNIFLQAINFNFLSQFDEVDELTMF